MKRFLLSLVALVTTSVCFAQDIIVQKDGSTIQAKVTKVTQSEVEYKKFNNQNGPTYTISTRDLQCINYENGTKDTFVSQTNNPSIVTNETATQFSRDKELYNMFNNSSEKAKKRQNMGWIIGGSVFGIGVALTLLTEGVLLDNDDVIDDDYIWIGPSVAGAGVITWAILYASGKHLEKKSVYSVQSAPIFQQEIKLGKTDRLMVGVDMLKDNTRRNQTLGLGVSYNF